MKRVKNGYTVTYNPTLRCVGLYNTSKRSVKVYIEDNGGTSKCVDLPGLELVSMLISNNALIKVDTPHVYVYALLDVADARVFDAINKPLGFPCLLDT